VVGILIVLITIALYYAAEASGAQSVITWGRAIAFLIGSIFSATVGLWNAAGHDRQPARCGSSQA